MTQVAPDETGRGDKAAEPPERPSVLGKPSTVRSVPRLSWASSVLLTRRTAPTLGIDGGPSDLNASASPNRIVVKTHSQAMPASEPTQHLPTPLSQHWGSARCRLKDPKLSLAIYLLARQHPE